jgi:hypothetical protein
MTSLDDDRQPIDLVRNGPELEPGEHVIGDLGRRDGDELVGPSETTLSDGSESDVVGLGIVEGGEE